MTWYDALNCVRAVEVRGVANHEADFTDYHRVFEEFRYDALGRRVWVRARKDCALIQHSIVEDLCKLSTLRRTVWDGEQELWEIQMPGSESSAYLENRNRYYDPATGRFTQEDPIGLAGGLNLYGFAGGDPVNFSDPFGLWPACPSCTTHWFLPRLIIALALRQAMGL